MGGCFSSKLLGPLARLSSWHRGGVHDRCRSASPVAASLGAAISRGPGSIAPSESIRRRSTQNQINPLTFCSFDSEVLRVLLPPPQALNKLKIFMRAYTCIQLLPSALPPPPITAELYNFLYSLINNFNS